MIWRVARLNADGVLAPEADAGLGETVTGSPAAETSLMGRFRQHLCSDETLAEQLQSGNAEALAILFKRYGPLAFSISRRILRDDSEAEDTVQQIFIDVFRSIHQFDCDKGTFKTWLLMFVYHRTFNVRRSQIANRFFETDPLEDSVPELQRLAASELLPENRVLVGQVLRVLQPRQRRTIELIYYEGLTAEEVAVQTGESVRVVRHNLYRGLDKLRQAFQAKVNPSETKEVGR